MFGFMNAPRCDYIALIYTQYRIYAFQACKYYTPCKTCTFTEQNLAIDQRGQQNLGAVYAITFAWATRDNDWMITNLYHGRDCSHPIVVPCYPDKSDSVYRAIESTMALHTRRCMSAGVLHGTHHAVPFTTHSTLMAKLIENGIEMSLKKILTF